MKLYYPIIATTYTNILYAVVKQYAIGAVNVWHVVRGLDQFASRSDRGKGWVTFNIRHLASDCGIKPDTLKKWIRESCKAGLLIDYRWLPEGRAWVRYTSIGKVCKQYGVTNLGSIIELSPIQVTQVKYHCTRAEILAKQARSKFAAGLAEKEKNKQRKVKKKLRLVPVRDLLRLQASELCSMGIEGVEAVSKDRIYTNENFIPYGASQLELAKSLGVTARTISNHLKERSLTRRWDSHLKDIQKAALPFSDDIDMVEAVQAVETEITERRSLNKLRRVHICQTDSSAEVNYSYYLSRHFADTERVNTHYFKYKNLFYKSLCCIFEKEYNLLSKKSLRRRVSAYLVRLSEDDPKSSKTSPLTHN
jgi:predicted transcriptional regulator